jgi:hypothetical protein
MQKVKESLAGRCHIEEIYPLTLTEMLSQSWEDAPKFSFLQQYLKSGKIPETLSSFQLYPDFPRKEKMFKYYLRFGGYPAVINPDFSDEERTDWLNNYVRTFLERDIRDLAEFRNLEPFVKTLKVISLLTGQLVNYSTLAKEANVSIKTAQKFLHYLEISYQAVILKSWHKNSLKRLQKSPKVHFLDPGIQKAVIRKRDDIAGNEFESAVVAEIFKQCHNLNFFGDFFHLKTLDGREVDLLIETDNGYIAIEIKQTNYVNNTDARHLYKLDELLDKPLLQSFVLSNDNNIKQLDTKILAIPAAMFLT